MGEIKRPVVELAFEEMRTFDKQSEALDKESLRELLEWLISNFEGDLEAVIEELEEQEK